MKFLTDKWEDEPRELTPMSKLLIMIFIICLAIFCSIKLIKFTDKYEQEQLEMQYMEMVEK